MFSSPPASLTLAACLVGDLGVQEIVPESFKPLISSESDSAALAPLQQEFCPVTSTLVRIQALVADSLRQRSLRERPPGAQQGLQSARRSRAVGVRAATSPGQAATTLASTSAPSATTTTDKTGTLGWGTA
jgi:hypothetical protein